MGEVSDRCNFNCEKCFLLCWLGAVIHTRLACDHRKSTHQSKVASDACFERHVGLENAQDEC